MEESNEKNDTAGTSAEGSIEHGNKPSRTYQHVHKATISSNETMCPICVKEVTGNIYVHIVECLQRGGNSDTNDNDTTTEGSSEKYQQGKQSPPEIDLGILYNKPFNFNKNEQFRGFDNNAVDNETEKYINVIRKLKESRINKAKRFPCKCSVCSSRKRT